MKRLLLSLALACSTVFAADTKPSEASIKELLTVSEAQKVVDSVMGQIDGMMKNMMDQATNGQPLTAAQQTAFGKYQTKVGALMREELTWAKFEPLYIQIYQASLTQEEVDGIVAFYKTSAGQALVKKMPMIMQKTMTAMPAIMGPIMQKIQPLAQELGAEMQAAAAAEAPPAPAPAETPAK